MLNKELIRNIILPSFLHDPQRWRAPEGTRISFATLTRSDGNQQHCHLHGHQQYLLGDRINKGFSMDFARFLCFSLVKTTAQQPIGPYRCCFKLNVGHPKGYSSRLTDRGMTAKSGQTAHRTPSRDVGFHLVKLLIRCYNIILLGSSQKYQENTHEYLRIVFKVCGVCHYDTMACPISQYVPRIRLECAVKVK